MITIATVLKCGGDYTTYHVEVLKRSIGIHINCEFKFVCLTDVYSCNFEKIKLVENWPTWWSKMELFKLKGPLIYFDLDTIIVGSLGPIVDVAKNHKFSILRDAFQGKKNPNAMQSSVMAWNGDMTYLYEKFKKNDKHIIKSLHGDQSYISREIDPKTVTFFQDVLPETLLSYKADINGKSIPKNTSIVFFHGLPRPWQQNKIPYDNIKK